MPRQPRQRHEVAHINLRLREPLRRALEREAHKHRFSLNNEIRLRLEDSLEKKDAPRTLDTIRLDMELVWARYSNRFLLLDLEEQLATALAQTKDPEVAKLAHVWLLHRARERQLTAGSLS
jgi:hypothetical protein